MSCCYLTEIYLSAAIDAAPEINPATQVTNRVEGEAPLAAIPTTRLVTEIIPSFAPVQLHGANLRVQYNVFQYDKNDAQKSLFLLEEE